MRKALLFILLLQTVIVFGQTQKEIDSLVVLADEYFTVDNVKSRDYADQVVTLSEKIDYQLGLANGFDGIGWVYLNTDDYPNAHKYFEKALKIYINENAEKEQSNILRGIGHAFLGQGLNSKALESYYDALRISKSIKDTRSIDVNEESIGGIFQLQGQNQKALDMFLEIDERAKAAGVNSDISYSIALTYYDLKDYEKAEMYTNRALKLANETKNKTLKIALLELLGSLAYEKDDYSSAIQFFNETITLATEDEAVLFIAEAKKGLGKVYLKTQNFEASKQNLNEALSIFKDVGYLNSLGYMYEELYKVSEASGDYKNALDYHKLYKIYNDSVFNDDQIRKISNQEFQFELEKNEALQKEKEKRIIAGISGAFIALLLLGWYFFNRAKNKALQKKLITQVNEQTLEIREKNERLEDLDKFKSRLYTNITHEFRTPLTVILGMSEQLESGITTLPPKKAKEKLSFIRRNGKSLLNLINQMLDLSKVENNQLSTNFVQNDIVTYLRYISESFHSHANARNIILKLKVEHAKIVMDYDPEKIRQIFSNLLSNAIKYSASGDKVLITIDSIDQNLVMSVKDSGMGISAENVPHIFDRFYQVDDAVSKTGGTGIGLALTKELVNLLNGAIEVDSELNKGTTFTVKIPITNTAAVSAVNLDVENTTRDNQSSLVKSTEDVNTLEPESKIAKLLVVEDNLDVSEYIASCLEQDYELGFAYNGAAGIEKAFEVIPEIIISDVMMPEKDGFELCETLKNDDRTSHIPIVLLTAKADVKSKIAGLKRGADAYLKKPFHQEELQIVLRNLLETRKKLQSKYSQLATQFPNPVVSEDVPDIEDVFVIKLREAVEERISDASLNAEDICKVIGMGRSNLYAKLNSVLGMSFNIYMRTLRLNKAKELLGNSSLNVSEVAYEVGFNDPKYFSRIFSDTFGVSPSKFKS